VRDGWLVLVWNIRDILIEAGWIAGFDMEHPCYTNRGVGDWWFLSNVQILRFWEVLSNVQILRFWEVLSNVGI
jgi:hypothetical protein